MKVAVMVIVLGVAVCPVLGGEVAIHKEITATELDYWSQKFSEKERREAGELIDGSLKIMSLFCVQVLKERDACLSQEEMLAICGSLREIMTTQVISMEILNALGIEVMPFHGSVSLD